jgi:chorismate mutase
VAEERVTVFVRGHVQGVGFRWWTRARALELGLVGSRPQPRWTGSRRSGRARPRPMPMDTVGRRCCPNIRRPHGARVGSPQRDHPVRPAHRGSRGVHRALTGFAVPPRSDRSAPSTRARQPGEVGTRHTLGRCEHNARGHAAVDAGRAGLRLRASIDNLDAALVYLLAERFRCTQQVGHAQGDRLGLATLRPGPGRGTTGSACDSSRAQNRPAWTPSSPRRCSAFIIAEVIRNHGVIAEQTSRLDA